MLEPRQADLPVLFLVLVVLPVVLYILLGKWSDTSNKKERINFYVKEASVESFTAEEMATASVIPPVVPPPTTAFRECARCHGPATTRCSRCKSVRYCSGRCQIIHWRQGHKEECQQLDHNYSSLKSASLEVDIARDLRYKGANHEFNGCPTQLPSPADTSASSVDACQMSKQEQTTSEKRVSRRLSKKMLNSKDKAAPISNDAYLNSTQNASKEAGTRHKLRGGNSTNKEYGLSEIHGINGSVTCVEYTDGTGIARQSSGEKNQNREFLSSAEKGWNLDGSNSSEELFKRNTFSHIVSSCESTASKFAADSECAKMFEPAKSIPKASREQVHLEKVRKGHGFGVSAPGMGNFTSANESHGSTSTGLMKTAGLKKLPKISRNTSELDIDKSNIV